MEEKEIEWGGERGRGEKRVDVGEMQEERESMGNVRREKEGEERE